MRIDETVQLVRLAIEQGLVLHLVDSHGFRYAVGPRRKAFGPTAYAVFGPRTYEGDALHVANNVVVNFGRAAAVSAVKRASSPHYEQLRSQAVLEAVRYRSGAWRTAPVAKENPVSSLGAGVAAFLATGALLGGIYLILEASKQKLSAPPPVPIFTPPTTYQV